MPVPSYLRRLLGQGLNSYSGGDDLADLIDSVEQAASGGGAGGVIIVAKTGGNYSTITEGLAAASSGDAVLVYPGTYAENVEIPAGVRLVGFPAAFAVTLSGTGTGTRVTMNNGSTLREFTVVGPESGSNPVIDASGVTTSAILFTITTQGAGHSGAMIDAPDSGTLAINLLAHNGGTIGGAFLDMADGGEARIVSGGMNLNAGQCDEVILMGNGAVVRGQNITVRPPYVATDLISIGANCEFQLTGLITPDVASPNITNVIHFTGDGSLLDLVAGTLQGSAYDLLADGGLTGTGTVFNLVGCQLSLERVSFPAGFASNAQVGIAYHDSGVQNDPAFRIAELSVGAPFAGRESSFGEGDSFVNSMRVWTYDDSASTYTEVTDEAKSRIGSTFTMPGDVGDKLLIGWTGKFPNMKLSMGQLAVLGSAEFELQVWNGSALADLEFMVTGADSPYDQYAQELMLNALDQQVRFATDGTAYSAWTARDPGTGVSMFYVEITVATANLSTAPIFERTKIGNNRTEINADGFVEMFGAAEAERPLLCHQRLTDDLQGASPSNSALAMTDNITLTPIDNNFQNGQLDGFAWMTRVEKGLDTSRQMTFRCLYRPSNTNTGDAVLEFRYGLVKVGDLANGTVTDTLIEAVETQSGTTDQVAEVQFTFTLPNAEPGDVVVFSFARQGADGDDTFTGNIEVILIETRGVFWR